MKYITIILIGLLVILLVLANRRDQILNDYNDCVFKQAEQDNFYGTPKQIWENYSNECQL